MIIHIYHYDNANGIWKKEYSEIKEEQFVKERLKKIKEDYKPVLYEYRIDVYEGEDLFAQVFTVNPCTFDD